METVKTKIIRIDYQPKETLGNILIYDDVIELFHAVTLELPWKNNEPRISCIAPGFYKLYKHHSPKFGSCLWIKGPSGENILEGGRSEVLIHRGNFNRDVLGCILPGNGFTDIDGDGLLDVTYSQRTLERILNVLPDVSSLEIVGQPPAYMAT